MALVARSDGRIERANAALIKGLGYSEDELREESIAELVHQVDRRRWCTGFRSRWSSGQR
jgi:PAS domain S-box-containing protein